MGVASNGGSWRLAASIKRLYIIQFFFRDVLTDDLDMEALSGSVPERAERAIAAGCDIALNCWAKMDDMMGIAARLPGMSERTAARLERALLAGASRGRGDQAQLLARRDALLASAGAQA